MQGKEWKGHLCCSSATLMEQADHYQKVMQVTGLQNPAKGATPSA
jgi:hypothetical protein